MRICTNGSVSAKASSPACDTRESRRGDAGGCASDRSTPLTWFRDMVPHCLEYARTAKEQGHPIVCIMCEFTPRELIMAAGAVPVCMCGGSAETIPAAERDLPANLCPLIKSTYGYHVLRTNPFLEMADLVVAETTCDGKKKMYELMAQSRPMYVLELPHNPDSIEALGFWEQQIRRFKRELERRFEVCITDDLLRKAIAVMNRERRLRRALAAAMEADGPPLTGRQLADLRSCISGIACDLRQYEQVLQWLGPRRENGLTDRVRVLLTGVPIAHGAERVLDIVEGCGGLVVSMENCTGIKPILDDVDEHAADPLAALAQKYFHIPCAVMSRNDRRVEALRRLVGRYRPQCVIDLVWQACLTYDVESARIRRLAEEEFGLPYLQIETDYSPSDSARIGMRIEALFETARARAGGSTTEFSRRGDNLACGGPSPRQSVYDGGGT
ncbi:MAG: 2-hydroxyacyl-CoA dehydratase [Planctomycetes bacterium]|nr:2-hydroxyacyl-CoA dehydratase [Planctomycetota bacterium]